MNVEIVSQGKFEIRLPKCLSNTRTGDGTAKKHRGREGGVGSRGWW